MKEQEIRKREVLDRYIKMVEEDAKKPLYRRSDFIHIDCPACGSQRYDFQFDKFSFNYVLCENCETLFVNPRPSVQSLINFYTNSKSSIYWVEKFFKPVSEARREKIFKPRVEFVKEIFKGMETGTIGDIGAGFGIFLEELAKFWQSARLIAIEPSLSMVKICQKKNLEVIPYAIEKVEGWEEKFDFLTAFELFEHLYDPSDFLIKAKNLLKPGGRLLMTTLNSEGFDIQVLWNKSKSVTPPHHLNFFNPRSIEGLLKSKGFIVEEILTPGMLDWDIVEGMIQMESTDVGRFWKLLSVKGSPEAKESLQNWIQQNLFSSHMRVIARKE